MPESSESQSEGPLAVESQRMAVIRRLFANPTVRTLYKEAQKQQNLKHLAVVGVSLYRMHPEFNNDARGALNAAIIAMGDKEQSPETNRSSASHHLDQGGYSVAEKQEIMALIKGLNEPQDPPAPAEVQRALEEARTSLADLAQSAAGEPIQIEIPPNLGVNSSLNVEPRLFVLEGGAGQPPAPTADTKPSSVIAPAPSSGRSDAGATKQSPEQEPHSNERLPEIAPLLNMDLEVDFEGEPNPWEEEVELVELEDEEELPEEDDAPGSVLREEPPIELELAEPTKVKPRAIIRALRETKNLVTRGTQALPLPQGIAHKLTQALSEARILVGDQERANGDEERLRAAISEIVDGTEEEVQEVIDALVTKVRQESVAAPLAAPTSVIAGRSEATTKQSPGLQEQPPAQTEPFAEGQSAVPNLRLAQAFQQIAQELGEAPAAPAAPAPADAIALPGSGLEEHEPPVTPDSRFLTLGVRFAFIAALTMTILSTGATDLFKRVMKKKANQRPVATKAEEETTDPAEPISESPQQAGDTAVVDTSSSAAIPSDIDGVANVNSGTQLTQQELEFVRVKTEQLTRELERLPNPGPMPDRHTPDWYSWCHEQIPRQHVQDQMLVLELIKQGKKPKAHEIFLRRYYERAVEDLRGNARGSAAQE